MQLCKLNDGPGRSRVGMVQSGQVQLLLSDPARNLFTLSDLLFSSDPIEVVERQLLRGRGHVVAMIAVSAWMSAERLERPMPPGWRLRGPGTALRMVVAQVGMKKMFWASMSKYLFMIVNSILLITDVWLTAW